MVVEAGIIASLVWLLWKGGRTAKKPTATKPSTAAWPKEGVPPAPPGAPAVPLSAEDKANIADAEARHAAETTKFQNELSQAKAKAAGDKYAQNEIAKKAKARQKALDDMRADIEAAKRGEGRG